MKDKSIESLMMTHGKLQFCREDLLIQLVELEIRLGKTTPEKLTGLRK